MVQESEKPYVQQPIMGKKELCSSCGAEVKENYCVRCGAEQI